MVHSGLKASRRRGFTMMEIMVTVAIIAILVALTVGVGVSVKNSSMKASTRATLSVLQNAMSRFIKDNPEPSGVASTDWLARLVVDPKEGPNITGQRWYVTDSARLSAFPTPLPAPQAFDAWGNPIYYLPSNKAGTMVVPAGLTFPSGVAWKLPVNPGPPAVSWVPKEQGYFWSLGPDGLPAGTVLPNGSLSPGDDIFSDGVSVSP